MHSVRLLLLIALAPVVVGALLWFVNKDLLFADGANFRDSAWQFLGAALSYVGVVLSAYAVFEVKRLTRRFLDRQLHPQLREELREILAKMSSLSQQPLADLRRETVLGKVSVKLKQLSKAESGAVVSIANDAIALLDAVTDRIDVAQNNEIINDVDEYWSLFRRLSELVDQIEADHQEHGASL